jgi:signal transduction histidine kinase
MRAGVKPKITIKHKFIDRNMVEKIEGSNLAKAKTYLKLEIEDNGIGFDNSYASKIFYIFHRLHGRSEYEGTGIGLALCKKIVENHGGAIFAKGTPDQGAVFTIILPVIQNT